MSVVLNLPKKLEKELAGEAGLCDMTLEDYLLRIIEEGPRPVLSKIKTGADLVAYWKSKGLLGTRPANTNSQKLARELRRKAERRSRD